MTQRRREAEAEEADGPLAEEARGAWEGRSSVPKDRTMLAAGALIVSQVKPIFDEALIQGVNVGRLSLTILVLYVVKGVSSYLSTTLVADAGQRAVTDLRNGLYEH